MLKRISVEGIKGLRNTTYELGKHNLLLGKSGTNKSALIEGIILGQSGTHPLFGSKGNEIMAISTDNPPTDKIGVELTYDQGGKEFSIRREYVKKADKVSQTIYINGGKETQQEASKRIEMQIGGVPFAFDIPGFIFDKKKDEFLFNVFGDKITQIPIPGLRNMMKVAIIALCEEYVSIVTYKYGISDLLDITEEKAAEIIEDFDTTMKTWSMKGVIDDIFAKIDKIPEGITIEEYCAKAYDAIDQHTNILSQELNVKKKSIQEDKDRMEMVDIADIEKQLSDAKDERSKMVEKIEKHIEEMNKHEQAVKLKRVYEDSMETVLTDEEIEDRKEEMNRLEKEIADLTKKETDLIKLREKMTSEYNGHVDAYNAAKKDEPSIALTVAINEMNTTLARIDERAKKQKDLDGIKIQKRKDVSKIEKERNDTSNKLAIEEAKTSNLKEMKKAAKNGKCHVCKSKITTAVEDVDKMIEDNSKEIAVLKKDLVEHNNKLAAAQSHNRMVDQEELRKARLEGELESYNDVSGVDPEKVKAEIAAKDKARKESLKKMDELDGAVTKANKEIHSIGLEITESKALYNSKRARYQECEMQVKENDRKKTDNEKRQKNSDAIKINEVQPFDETVYQYKAALDQKITDLEAQRDNVLGQKHMESQIRLKEQEALVLEGQAKFSRVAEKEVKGFNNKLLDKVLDPIRDRASKVAEKVFGHPVALDTSNCGLYVSEGIVRDIRALSGGERTTLAIIILAAALEEVKTPEKLLIVEGAEMDVDYTSRIFEILTENNFELEFILASNKTSLNVRDEVNVIRMG